MRKLLLNPTPLFRKLRQLSLLLTLLLVPQLAGAQGYNITIAGTQVTDANATNVLADDYSSVSYNSVSNTLTLKGLYTTGTIEVSQDLTVNLVGCNTVSGFTINGSSNVTFTTSTTLPGLIHGNLTVGTTTPTYENGLLYVSGGFYNGSAYVGTIERRPFTNPDIGHITGYVSSNVSGDYQIYCPIGFYASYAEYVDNKYIKVSTTGTGTNKTAFLHPASGYNGSNLITKVYFQFDWGTCTNKNVSVQVKGFTANPNNNNYLEDDGNTYSELISLSSYGNGDIVEIPLTSTVTTSDVAGLVFTSTDDFSFVPIAVGFYKIESYNLTVGGVAVTNINAGSITGTNISGNVSFEATTNTLKLKNAEITGEVFYSGTTTLNFALDGTNSIINTGGTYAIGTSDYTNGLLNFAKATGASSAELTLTEGSSGIPISAGTPTLGSDLYWKPTSANTMVITSDPEFIIIDNLIMTDNRTVSGDNSAGTITYSSSNKTLTIDGFQKNFGTRHAIKTGVSGLKVKLIGASTINCSADSAVFHAFSSSASIQFIRNDATSKLTMTGTAFNNFAADKKTYDGHLFYYEYSGNKYIAQPDALSLGSSVLNDGNNNYFTHAKIYYSTNDRSDSNGYTAKYSSANPVIKYSIDYVDTNVPDVTNATYDTSGDGIKMNSPAIMTAWVEVGGAKSEVSTGVRFGVVANCVEMEFNGEEKEIDFSLQPASKAEGFSINFPNVPFAAFNSSTQKLTVKGCAKEDVYIGPTQPNTPPTDFSLLADSIKVVFNVTPPKPTLSLESGVYYVNQQITVTPGITGNDYVTELKINDGNPVTYPYTFSSVFQYGYGVRAYTKYTPSDISSDFADAKYYICNKPEFSGQYADQSSYTGDKTGNVIVVITSSDLPDDCKLMYYIGSDQSKAVEYTTNIELKETTTLNAFIRYTSTSGPTVTYDSEPITKSYTVNQEAIITFADGQNYLTYYEPNFSLTKPAGLKVYTITGVSGNSVTTSALDYIPQGVAVLLEKDGEKPAGGYVAETYTGTQGSFASNKLKYANTDVAATDDTYILYKNEFLKATGTIPNQHCYLDLSGVAPSRGMYGIGDGSTAIDATLMDHERMNKEEWYDLQGRRIQKPTKPGLYIVNGKKVVINNK